MDELIERLADLRDILDRIDGTEFGKLNQLLDQAAMITDKAIALAATLSDELGPAST